MPESRPPPRTSINARSRPYGRCVMTANFGTPEAAGGAALIRCISVRTAAFSRGAIPSSCPDLPVWGQRRKPAKHVLIARLFQPLGNTRQTGKFRSEIVTASSWKEEMILTASSRRVPPPWTMPAAAQFAARECSRWPRWGPYSKLTVRAVCLLTDKHLSALFWVPMRG
jgi:hypothetical protein